MGGGGESVKIWTCSLLLFLGGKWPCVFRTSIDVLNFVFDAPFGSGVDCVEKGLLLLWAVVFLLAVLCVRALLRRGVLLSAQSNASPLAACLCLAALPAPSLLVCW